MKLTLEQFVNLVYSQGKMIYFYEEEPGIDEHGNEDFSRAEIFLAFYSAMKPNHILLPEVCNRTISQIWFIDGVIRVVLDDEDRHIGGASKDEM